MRAILNATGFDKGLHPLIKQSPTPLFRVVDKPIIVHIIEHLAPQGITEIDIILSHHPEMIEATIEEGKRWGVKVTYHLAREADKPFAILLPAAMVWQDKMVLLACADILPKINLQRLIKRAGTSSVLLTHANRGWLGWGLLSIAALHGIKADTPFKELPSNLKHYEEVLCNGVLMSTQNFEDLQHSNVKSLEARSSSLFPATSRMVQPGVWLSRATILHPNTRIEPPVFIGENTHIMDDAQIGPSVVIENNCVVDKHSIIERSLIRQQSYIGEALEIRDSIVDHSTLINLAFGTTIEISDDFILSQLSPPPFKMTLFHTLKRFLAVGILLVVSPFLMPLIYLIGLQESSIVRLPAVNEPQSWELFSLLRLKEKKGWKWLKNMPMLINIIRGEIAFVGLQPRTAEEIEALPAEWKAIVLRSKTGMITLANLDYAQDPELADPFTSEAYYASRAGVLLDLGLMGRWAILKAKHALRISSH